MKKYYVTYEDKSGDTTNVWTMASSKEDAISNIQREYWDVKRIIMVRPA